MRISSTSYTDTPFRLRIHIFFSTLSLENEDSLDTSFVVIWFVIHFWSFVLVYRIPEFPFDSPCSYFIDSNNYLIENVIHDPSSITGNLNCQKNWQPYKPLREPLFRGQEFTDSYVAMKAVTTSTTSETMNRQREKFLSVDAWVTVNKIDLPCGVH